MRKVSVILVVALLAIVLVAGCGSKVLVSTYEGENLTLNIYRDVTATWGLTTWGATTPRPSTLKYSMDGGELKLSDEHGKFRTTFKVVGDDLIVMSSVYKGVVLKKQ